MRSRSPSCLGSKSSGTVVRSVSSRSIRSEGKKGRVGSSGPTTASTGISSRERIGNTFRASVKSKWIGIDVTHLAISLIEKRMKDAFPGIAFTVEGRPQDLAAALDLAERDKYQFQWWAVSLVDALPFGGKKKGADGGIDGLIYFKPVLYRRKLIPVLAFIN